MLHIKKPCLVKCQVVNFTPIGVDSRDGIPLILTRFSKENSGYYDIDLDLFQEQSYDFTEDNGITHRKMLEPCFVTGPTTLTQEVTYTARYGLIHTLLRLGSRQVRGCASSQKGQDLFGENFFGYDHISVDVAPGRVSAEMWCYFKRGVVRGPRDTDFRKNYFEASVIDDATYRTTETSVYIDRRGISQPPEIKTTVRKFNPRAELMYQYSDFDFDDLMSSIRKQIVYPARDHSEETKYFACKDAISHLDVIGINVYEALEPLKNGLRSIPKSYKRMLNDIRNFVNSGGQDIKSFCRAYLSKKYGTDNDIRDLQGLTGLKTLGTYLTSQVLHQHGAYNNLRATVHCSPFLSGVNWTDVLGITPNASNLWAVIPFSFAVDWFLKGGDNLREIELAAMWGNDCYHIHSVCYSTKVEFQNTITVPGFLFSNDIVFSLYERWAEEFAPDFVYEVPEYFSGLEDHIIEFGSLIFTNL